MNQIVSTAPGKLVLSGEYAVLVGTPALVLAVDRRVRCELRPRTEAGWQFTSTGFEATRTHDIAELTGAEDLGGEDPGRICQAILRSLIDHDIDVRSLPPGLEVALDSTAFYSAGTKLGLGSSAAICVALTSGLLELAQARTDPLPIALAAHHGLQGGRGSGLDVATSQLGGLVEFQRGASANLPTTTRRELPAGVHLGFFWSGSATPTAGHLKRFEQWTETSRPPALSALAEAAVGVTRSLHDADSFMRQLRTYTRCLRAVDEVSGIGIYGEAHLALAELADSCGVLYKPSGAGGNDVGIAVAGSAAAIEALAQQAGAVNVATLALGMEQYGIEVSRR